MIAVIFHPLGLNPFVRCSMSELYNHYIDVEDLEDIELNHLKRNISAEPAVETCIRLIERFFMQRLVDADCNYQRTQHAIRQIINQPQIDVNTLAESTCLGYSTQAADHPILWAADESYYLKFIIFQVVDEK